MLGHKVSEDADGPSREWRKSSRSYGAGQCVEVATPSRKRIVVRDSVNIRSTVLTFSATQWNDFVASIRSGRSGL